jgi:hypothetical protein
MVPRVLGISLLSASRVLKEDHWSKRAYFVSIPRIPDMFSDNMLIDSTDELTKVE